MASQLQQIVELLNQVFNLELSLVVFDEKEPGELLEILKRVLEYLEAAGNSSSGQIHPGGQPQGGSQGGPPGSSSQVNYNLPKNSLFGIENGYSPQCQLVPLPPGSLIAGGNMNSGSTASEDNPEIWCRHISEFLHILGYPSMYQDPLEFQSNLMCGEKRCIHNILYWLMSNLESLKKRSFLARFCVNLDIPEDFLRDNGVFDLYQEYKSLQSQFKSTHQYLEKERQSKSSPHDLQREVMQLATESEQLTQKIAQFREKSKNTQGFQTLLNITSLLRREQEEEARLSERLIEQKLQLDNIENIYLEKSRRVHELRQAQSTSDGTQNGAEAMLKILRIETRRNKDSEQRLLREKEEKLKKLSSMEVSLQEPSVSQATVAEAQSEVHSLESQCDQLEIQVNASMNNSNAGGGTDSKLAVYRQQANLVQKKKDLAIEELKKLIEERDNLSKVIVRKEKEFEEKQGVKYRKKEDFKAYAGQLRDKAQIFKRQKEELSAIRSEVAILGRTQQILTELHPLPQDIRKREAAIEKTSLQKAEEDSAKGASMDELSSLVTQITQQLKEQKKNLQPMIEDLREVRDRHSSVETRYNELKSTYEQVKSEVDGDLKGSSEECKGFQDQIDVLERQYHELQHQLGLYEKRLMLVNKEGKMLREGGETVTQRQVTTIEEVDRSSRRRTGNNLQVRNIIISI